MVKILYGEGRSKPEKEDKRCILMSDQTGLQPLNLKPHLEVSYSVQYQSLQRHNAYLVT